MRHVADRKASPANEDVERLWYVENRHLRTRAAAEAAIDVAHWIDSGGKEADRPDEHLLFVSLHTCAYRAKGQWRSKRMWAGAPADWLRRWRRIREYIVERNLGLVYSAIAKFGTKQADEDDLLSDGMLALTHAVDRFNPWRGFRFSTYAWNVIFRALIRRSRREGSYRRRVPVQFGVPFELEEDVPRLEKELYIERLGRALEGNLGGLTDLESRIVTHRFPEAGTSRLTFREIGQAVGLSKERVRQIQKIALDKLRNVLNEDPELQ